MRFEIQFLATLALGTVLGVMAAPISDVKREAEARPPSDLQYDGDFKP